MKRLLTFILLVLIISCAPNQSAEVVQQLNNNDSPNANIDGLPIDRQRSDLDDPSEEEEPSAKKSKKSAPKNKSKSVIEVCENLPFYGRWDLSGNYISQSIRYQRSDAFYIKGSKTSQGTYHNFKRVGQLSKTFCREILKHRDVLIDKEIRDARQFCPNYSKFSTAQKLQMLVFYFSVKAEMESTFDSNVESPDQYNKANKGILQLSQPEVDKYYNCHVGDDDNLKKDKVSIACGVKMFARYLKKDRVIQDCRLSQVDRDHCGASRWWGVLRKKHLKKFQQRTRLMPGCTGSTPEPNSQYYNI